MVKVFCFGVFVVIVGDIVYVDVGGEDGKFVVFIVI